MERLDAGEFGTTVAHEFSFAIDAAQLLLDEVISENRGYEISVVQAKEIRNVLTACSAEEFIGQDRDSVKAKIREILASEASELKESKSDLTAIKLPSSEYNHFFPDMPEDEVVKMTIAALRHYFGSLSEKIDKAV